MTRVESSLLQVSEQAKSSVKDLTRHDDQTKTGDLPHWQISEWLHQAQSCFDSQEVDRFVELFSDNGYWRDILTIEPDFNSLVKHSIKAYLKQHQLGLPSLKNLEIDRPHDIKQAEDGLIQSFVKFETEVYRGTGLIILKHTQDKSSPLKAFLFSTQVREVKGHEEQLGFRRPLGIPVGASEPGETLNWLDKRFQGSEKYKHGVDPTVLIIGGGQNGLMLAARLKLLGIETLIVEKTKRLGDCWRLRYHSLSLHDPVWADHFAYLPYPENWPIYTPKDKLANWMEHYADTMELDVWLQTTVVPGSQYDPVSGKWTVDVQLPGGVPLVRLRPGYLILATGLASEPNWPQNISNNIQSYSGKLLHSSQYSSGKEFVGKRAVVIGACNSGHDIAQDLWENGAAEVTMVQRSKTYVMSSQYGMPALLKGSYEEGGLPTEDVDLLMTSLPINQIITTHRKITQDIKEFDKELLNGLEKVGFRLDPYPDGLFLKYFRQGGGYYIDVGCSKLIADRKIKLKTGQEITRLTEDSLEFEDGASIKADVIVLATGFRSIRETVKKVISQEVADKLGPIWGKDNQGEIPGVWRICGQPGLWLMCGNFFQARCFSKHVATQILLQILKIHDKNWSGHAHDKVPQDDD